TLPVNLATRAPLVPGLSCRCLVPASRTGIRESCIAAGGRYLAQMTSQREKAERFLALHHGDGALLMPNPWDVGSARILESLGFQALATTSFAHAATLGRLDGGVTVEEALAHAAAIAGACDVPVSADLENAFADDPQEGGARVSAPRTH